MGKGDVNHPVSTANADAQRFFNQGLANIYAFNHEESVRSFKRAAELDPQVAMAYWGVALSLGSNYNLQADAPQGNNTASDVLKVAEQMLAGKMALAQGDKKTGIELLYRAAEAEDA